MILLTAVLDASVVIGLAKGGVFDRLASLMICLRATGIVVLLKDRGLIPAVKPVLDRMRRHGFGIDDSIYRQALQAAGEGPAP